MEQPLRVGQLAHATGVPAKTIRYYEVGVLPLALRSASGYRQYSIGDVDRLVFVRRARTLGLPLAQLKVLTTEVQGKQCSSIRPRLRALVTEQLGAVQKQIAELHLLEHQLMDVLHRLEKAATPPNAKGCHCLDGLSHN
jgi:MerR family transcriptional regulator, copper efflux regulator